jgi:hypothetical protein
MDFILNGLKEVKHGIQKTRHGRISPLGPGKIRKGDDFSEE